MEKVLDTKFLLLKTDEKTHKKISFNIDKKINELKIEFQYTPKNVIESENIIEAFKEDKCDMNLKEAEFFKDIYLKGEEKLKNLVTLSLYCENEYIGCAHRGLEKQTIIISTKESTLGFNNVMVREGQWDIVLSIHGIHSDKIDISLKVFVLL